MSGNPATRTACAVADHGHSCRASLSLVRIPNVELTQIRGDKVENLKASTVCLVCLSLACLWPSTDAAARGFGGGARGGGGFSRPSAGRTPSVSRPSVSRPSVSRPSVSRPSVSRPSAGTRPSVGTRPSPGTRPSVGTRPAAGVRPSVGARPSQGQLQNFLDLKPSTGGVTRPSTGIAAGAAGGAAAEFLRSRPSAGQLPARGPEARPGLGDRTALGDRTVIGDRTQVNIGTRPSQLPAGLANHRPDRIENRQQWQQQRQQRRDQVRDQVRENHPRFDFWADHPNWARWRVNRPYRWATWGLVTGWFPWGWSEPTYYSYGDNVYYQGDTVYYGDNAVASSEEYAQQAQSIATSAPEVTDDVQWMPLGVFAVTQDGQSSGPAPTMYLQLQVSKEGVIAGTFQNTATSDVKAIEGAVDKKSQRSAWNVQGKEWPIPQGDQASRAERATTRLHLAV